MKSKRERTLTVSWPRPTYIVEVLDRKSRSHKRSGGETLIKMAVKKSLHGPKITSIKVVKKGVGPKAIVKGQQFILQMTEEDAEECSDSGTVSSQMGYWWWVGVAHAPTGPGPGEGPGGPGEDPGPTPDPDPEPIPPEGNPGGGDTGGDDSGGGSGGDGGGGGSIESICEATSDFQGCMDMLLGEDDTERDTGKDTGDTGETGDTGMPSPAETGEAEGGPPSGDTGDQFRF